MKKIVLRTAVKVMVIVVLISVVGVFTNSAIVSNDIALSQMQNSDEYIVYMGLYKKLKPIVPVLAYGISIGIVVTIVKDIYHYVKGVANSYKNGEKRENT